MSTMDCQSATHSMLVNEVMDIESRLSRWDLSTYNSALFGHIWIYIPCESIKLLKETNSQSILSSFSRFTTKTNALEIRKASEEGNINSIEIQTVGMTI